MGTNARAAVDDTFTANTVEGVAVTYKVLTEDGTTGTVQVGNGSETSGNQAIDKNTAGAITIPASVTKNGVTYSVTQIGYNAFKACANFTSVTIPGTVTTIKEYAFSGCKNGLFVYITDLAAWCNITFANDTSNPLYNHGDLYLNGILATNLDIPEGVQSINAYAFYNCNSLASINIPSTITTINNKAFYGCNNCLSVYITDLAAWCNITFVGDTSNPLYNEGGLYLNGILVTELDIPEGVESIKAYAFYHCKSIASINIPSTVTSLGYCAFSGCSNITSITVPSSVTNIESYAIYKCPSLERVIMESPTPPSKSEYSIGNNKRECLLIVPEGSRSAYSSWAVNFLNIKEIGKENVIEQGDVAIHPLPATNVSTGEAVEGYYAFVTYIDVTPGQRKAIIYHPSSLYDPECDFDSNPCWDEQYKHTNVAIFKEDTGTYSYCSLTIPSTVTDSEGNEYTIVGIGANAAYDFISAIQKIRIPKTITHIGRYAFRGLNGLTGNVILPSSVRQIGAPGKTSFANIFTNDLEGNDQVKGLYIMHSDASDFNWYDGKPSSGGGYFLYRNNYSKYSYLYVSQDIRNTYESTSGNGVWAWRQGNAYSHHYTSTFDPAFVAGISGDEERYELGTYTHDVQNSLDIPLTIDNFTSSNEDVVRIVSLDGSCLTYEVLDSGSATISFSYPGDDVLDELSSSITVSYPEEIFTETVDGNELTFRVLTEGNESNTVQLGAALYDDITLRYSNAPTFFNSNDWYDQFTVPETVEHEGKTYTVTAIGAYAFANFYGNSVVLPPTIETIGFRAFYYESYNPGVNDLYVNSLVPPTLVTYNSNSPFNSEFYRNCVLHVPEGYKAAYTQSDWNGYFKRIIEPVDAIVICGVVYTGEADIFGDGSAVLTWEPEESAGGSIPVANSPRKAREKSGTENLVPVLTLNNATINYTGNRPAIEVNSYPNFFIRLRGQNTVTTANANAAISVGTAKGEDFDEVSLIILNDDEQEINYPEPTNAPRKANGEGSNELPSLTINNTTAGGNGIYINCGSFNVQNCAVDATGVSYGLRYKETSGGGGGMMAPRHQAEENGGPRKVVAPDGPVNPEWYAGYLNVFEGSELTLHGNEAALWGAGNRYFENVGVIESDLNAYMSQYKYYEMPGFRGYNPYYGGTYDYETYEIWVSNDNDNWQPKYAKMLTIAPNTLYAYTDGGVEMKFTIVSESAKTVRVGDEEGRQAIDEYYNGPITIPETVDGYSVVGIATGAFTGCRLTSIELPETEAFSWIGNSAFESSSLQEIYISGNVTKIGRAAFEYCSNLRAAYLDAATGLKSLPDAMFYECYNLNWVQLPSSVSSIGYNAFTDCSNTLQIACFAVVPPSLDDYIGSGTTLWVPYGCYNKYKNSDWNQYFDEIDLIPAEYNNIVTIEPEDEYVVNVLEDMIMDDGQGNTEALPLENAVAGGVYYNLVSNEDEFNGIDVDEGCIVISSTTSEEDMATVVESELQSETMQNNFCGLIVEVNGKGTLKINCMTVGSGVLTVRIGNGAPMPYTSQDGTTPIAIPFDVPEPTLIYIYASDSEAGSGVKGYRMMGRRRAGESNEISGVMIYQMSVEEHVPVYNIEIAGKMVTGENASNFTYYGLNRGTISFDPETYTLTLDNVDMEEAKIVINGCAADEDVQHLTINLVGYNVMKTFENAFYVWEIEDRTQLDEYGMYPMVAFLDEMKFTSTDGTGTLMTMVVDDDNTVWDGNGDDVWDDPIYAWKIGGNWCLFGAKEVTFDHCQVGGGMIDAESITVQNGAFLGTSREKIDESTVTCGEGISYRGYTNGLYVYGPNEFIITELVNISQYGLATFCSPNNDLNFTEVEGVKAYIATGFNSATNQLTLTRVYNVPAGTGLLLWSVSGETVENMQIPVESTTNTYENNMFVGCVEDTWIQPTVGDYTNFVLSKHSGDDFLGFYTFTTSNENGRLIEAGKAYLRIPTDQLNTGGDIKGFSLVFNDDDPTAISVIDGGQSTDATEIYNLAGQRLNKIQKGVNILNGKKILK